LVKFWFRYLKKKSDTNTLSLDKIDERRYRVLDDLLSAHENLLDEFLHNRHCCTFACNAIHYGALTKELCIRGLLFPRPQIPFLGYSFDNITTSIRSIPNLEWCDLSQEQFYSSKRQSPHDCRLASHLKSIISRIESNLDGLLLTDITPKDLEAETNTRPV
jgi:hypothetical protein